MTAAAPATPEGLLALAIADYCRVAHHTVIDLRTLLKMLAPEPPLLGQCGYEHPPTSCGACNGWQCQAMATVHNLAAEQDVCLTHHRQIVQKGY